MIRESRAITAEGESIELDPFAFWPDIASRLVGFGGHEIGDNPDYALHTRYVSCGTGPILFTLRFAGLKAQRGTLILRIHELPEVMGAHARQVAMSQTQLADLIRGDGTVVLPATARTGNHYAILGYIYGDTVATARSLSIEVARRTSDRHDSARPSRFGADERRVGIIPQIVGDHEGTLVTPVSQMCTMRQVGEPIFRVLLAQLGMSDGASLIDRWEQVFVARVLDRYDVARSGARGLGIGELDSCLPPWLVQHGCSLLLTTPDDVPGTIELPPTVETVRMSPYALDELGGLDFAWVTRGGGVGASDRQTLLRFIEDILRTLKPGGLLVIVTPLDVAPRAIGDDKGPLLRRPDIDRIVLVLLSRGHQVAQVRPWGEAVAEANDNESVIISAFGLIVRKAI